MVLKFTFECLHRYAQEWSDLWDSALSAEPHMTGKEFKTEPIDRLKNRAKLADMSTPPKWMVRGKRSPDAKDAEFLFKYIWDVNKQRCSIPIVYTSLLHPSIADLGSLQKCYLRELKTETRLKKRCLFLKTVSHVYEGSGMIVVTKDQKGDHVLLYSHCSQPAGPKDASYNIGTVFAIKEPFYGVCALHCVAVRVDSPSDILLIERSTNLCPKIWRKKKQAAKTKAAKIKASETDGYTHSSASVDDKRKTESILNDSSAVLNPEQTDQISPEDMYERSQALYRLGQYQDALDLLRDVQALEASQYPAEEVQEAIQRASSRIREAEHGLYEWSKVAEEAGGTAAKLDRAAFTRLVEVKNSEIHGMGLFVKEERKVGDLVMVEKAMVCVAENNASPHQRIGFDLHIKKAFTVGQMAVLQEVLHRLHHDPEMSYQFYDLHGGNYPRTGAEHKRADGAPIVNSGLARAICAHNLRGGIPLRPGDYRPAGCNRKAWMKRWTDSFRPLGKPTVGIWPLASRLNHSCVGNCIAVVCGDLLIVRACKDLVAGEELTFTQQVQNYGKRLASRHDLLKEDYQIDCRCPLCIADESAPKSDTGKRLNIEKWSLKLSVDVLYTCCEPSRVERSEEILDIIKHTYEHPVYENLPRPALILLMEALTEYYMGKEQYEKAMKMAKDALVLGLNMRLVDPDDDGEIIIDTGAVSDPMASCVNVMVNMARIYDDHYKMPRKAESMMGNAKKWFRVHYGSDFGFDELFEHLGVPMPPVPEGLKE